MGRWRGQKTRIRKVCAHARILPHCVPALLAQRDRERGGGGGERARACERENDAQAPSLIKPACDTSTARNTPSFFSGSISRPATPRAEDEAAGDSDVEAGGAGDETEDEVED